MTAEQRGKNGTAWDVLRRGDWKLRFDRQVVLKHDTNLDVCVAVMPSLSLSGRKGCCCLLAL